MEPLPKRRYPGNNTHATTMATESVPLMGTSLTYPSSVSPAPSNDSYADYVSKLPEQIITPKVVRPVPKRISEQFYEEAYEEGLTMYETNEAAILAHDWHRKWTHQDEEYHVMQEENFYRSHVGPIHAGYFHTGFSEKYGCTDDSAPVEADSDIDNNHHLLVLQREGARNPSLASPHDDGSVSLVSTETPLKEYNVEYNLEGKMAVSPTATLSSTNSYSSSRDPVSQQEVLSDRNSDIAEDDEFHDYSDDSFEDDDDSYDYDPKSSEIQRPLPIRPNLVKPFAVRANPSECVFPQPTHARLSPFALESQNPSGGRIPHDIITNQHNCVEGISPMSCSQATGSSSLASMSPIGNSIMGMTVFQTDQDYPHLVEDDRLSLVTKEEPSPSTTVMHKMEKARDDVLHVLAITEGDIESEDFKTKVEPLEKFFQDQDVDTRKTIDHTLCDDSSPTSPIPESIDGTWLTLSKPNYFGKLGHNDDGDPMYTLGRMSFDMFSPTNLICSLQGNFNQVQIVDGEERKAMLQCVPKKLREEVESGKTTLRSYNVVTAFTIEPSMAAYPNEPNKDVIRPIKGIMTTYGYCLPDPEIPNRHSIWFTGGRIEPNNNKSDIQAWKDFFSLHPPKHSFGEKAKLLAVKLLMGATIPEEIDPEDGSMNYVFTRPLGGHGMAYVDVVYLDNSLRIARGQRGTTYVFSRVPNI